MDWQENRLLSVRRPGYELAVRGWATFVTLEQRALAGSLSNIPRELCNSFRMWRSTHRNICAPAACHFCSLAPHVRVSAVRHLLYRPPAPCSHNGSEQILNCHNMHAHAVHSCGCVLLDTNPLRSARCGAAAQAREARFVSLPSRKRHAIGVFDVHEPLDNNRLPLLSKPQHRLHRLAGLAPAVRTQRSERWLATGQPLSLFLGCII
jgi:hypothetical protein